MKTIFTRIVALLAFLFSTSIAFSQVPPQTTLGLLQYPRTAVVMKQIMDTQVSESPARALEWANSLPDTSSQEEASKLDAAIAANFKELGYGE